MKSNKIFMIGERVLVKRGNVYDGSQPIYRYESSERFGRHETREAARRAYMVFHYEGVDHVDISQWNDDFVKLHFNTLARNEKTVKLLTITA